MTDIVVIDLDGTLCNNNHRAHLVQAGEWDEFHSMCGGDHPYRDVHELISFAHDFVSIIALTGRTEKYRAQTLDWFRRHHINQYIDALLMRPDEDYRKSFEVKKDLLTEYFGGDWNQACEHILFVLDDNERSVEQFRNEGISAWQVRVEGVG